MDSKLLRYLSEAALPEVPTSRNVSMIPRYQTAMASGLTQVQHEAFCVELLDWGFGVTRKQEHVPVLVPHDSDGSLGQGDVVVTWHANVKSIDT